MAARIKRQRERVPETRRHQFQVAAVGVAAKNISAFAPAAVRPPVAAFQSVLLAQVLAQANVEPALGRKRDAADAVVRIIAPCLQFENGFAHPDAALVAQDHHAVAVCQIKYALG